MSKLDPLQIFRQGHAFCEAFKRLSKAADTDAHIIPVSTPAMVMSAFASELLLKCLICLDTGNVPPRHELRKLFDRLPKVNQDRIEQLWNLTVVPLRKAGWETARGRLSDAIVSGDLRANLSAGNDAFRQMRYIYEPQQAKQICFFLYDLPKVLRFVILERKPESSSAPDSSSTSTR
jgi:hypothetical protein